MFFVEAVHLDLSVFWHEGEAVFDFGRFSSFALAAGGQAILGFFVTIYLW
jgi:hypothetical protein